jgi:hypothetical protein
MSDWQVGRIVFGPKNKSSFHGMDGDENILARIARRLSLHRSGEIRQGDVVIPIKPTESKNTPPPSTLFTAEEVVELTYKSVRYGEKVAEVVEDLANRLGYFGACEPDYMNGDVCTKKDCRQCFVSEYKQILAHATNKDIRSALADLIVEKSSR